MKKQVSFLLLCVVITLLFSGCWSRTEPKSLSMAISVLFDIKDDGTYLLTKECLKLSGDSGGGVGAGGGGGGGGGEAALLIKCEGKTVSDAVRDELNGKSLFGGILKARLFSERFAQKGMVSTMDFLTRDHLTDETSLVTVIKGKSPEDIYLSSVGLADTVGDYLDQLSDTQPEINSESVFVTTLDFIKDYNAEGKEPVTGMIEIIKNEQKFISDPQMPAQSSQSSPSEEYKMVYTGLAAFKDDKLVGYMNGIEARAYNFITNNLKSTLVPVASGDNYTVAKVIQSGSDIKTSIQDGKATIDVKISPTFSIIQEDSQVDLNNAEILKQIEKQLNLQIESEISESVEKAQKEFQSDIFGFGSFVHIQHPKVWKDIKTEWNDIFSNAQINVTVDSMIIMSGESEQALSMED